MRSGRKVLLQTTTCMAMGCLQDLGSDSARFAFTSQLAVLRSCSELLSTLLKSGGSVLLAAKVLVISRLLHTKLSKRPSPPPYLETLRMRLVKLRRRLLGRIDRRFKSLDVVEEELVEAMCAFSLATSSGPRDVVKHFHHLRLEAIVERMGEAKEKYANVLIVLQLYVKTLQDTRAVVPGQLSHALERLKAVSIYRSRDLYELIELNLDTHERWIGDDIIRFTPYIRHDDLSKSEAEKLLKGWAKVAVGKFLEGLKGRIQDVHDPRELIQLRQQVLELWLGQHQHSLGIDSAEVLDALRDAFNDQAILLIQVRAAALKTVGETAVKVIRDWQPGVSDAFPSLWSTSMTSIETSNGSKMFRQRLMDLSMGKNEALQAVTAQYGSWLQSLKATEDIIDHLKTIKWADDIDEIDDEDDLVEKKQILLSEDDPRLLQDALHTALVDGFAELANELSSTASSLQHGQEGHQAIFILKVWREIRQHSPQSFRDESLGCNTILQMLNVVAKAALTTPLDQCSDRIAKAERMISLPARQLWEGDPELPVLPSPWAYRLLSEVVQSMADYSTDIWSPEAVKCIKRLMIEGLANVLDKPTGPALQVNGHVNGEASADQASHSDDDRTNKGILAQPHDSSKTNGEELDGRPTSPPSDAAYGDTINGVGNPPTLQSDNKQEIKIQKLFDILYLLNAIAVQDLADEDNALIRYQRSIVDTMTALEAEALERMKKNAAEYWKRTSLLFGLLA